MFMFYWGDDGNDHAADPDDDDDADDDDENDAGDADDNDDNDDHDHDHDDDDGGGGDGDGDEKSWWIMMNHDDSWWIMMNQDESRWIMMNYHHDWTVVTSDSWLHSGTKVPSQLGIRLGRIDALAFPFVSVPYRPGIAGIAR